MEIPLGESGIDCEGGVESVHSLPSSCLLYHTKSKMQVCLIKKLSIPYIKRLSVAPVVLF